jgi:hypothetical protein
MPSTAGRIYKTNAAIGFGSPSILFTTGVCAGLTYITESNPTDRPVELAERRNGLNQPNGAVQVEQAATKQVVAQMATSASPVPQSGDEFIEDGVTFFVGQVGTPREQNGIWKVNFAAREKI